MPRAGRCPNCGEPVSPFAAGCALCGADLEAHRRERESSVTARACGRVPDLRPRVPRSLGGDAFPIALLVIAPLLSPFVGLLLAALIGFDASSKRNDRVRNVAIAAGALSIAFFALRIPSPVYYVLYGAAV